METLKTRELHPLRLKYKLVRKQFTVRSSHEPMILINCIKFKSLKQNLCFLHYFETLIKFAISIIASQIQILLITIHVAQLW